MNENEWLAKQFEGDRDRLRSVAYRLLGSQSEADDAVQEAWLRLNRSDTSAVENLRGWLTTVVSRVCLDMLRSRTSRREEPLDPEALGTSGSREHANDPAQEVELADSVGLALLVVLETLTPAERVAFVLHDTFDLPFDDIAPIVGRTPAATRQLASRARRRVRGATPSDNDVDRRREVVEAFLAASREGNFQALLALLDPDVVLRADSAAVQANAARRAAGAPAPKLAPEVRGVAAVAETFKGGAAAARPALVNGVPGLAWAPGGTTRAVFEFEIKSGKIVAIDLLADQERLGEIDLVILDG